MRHFSSGLCLIGACLASALLSAFDCSGRGLACWCLHCLPHCCPGAAASRLCVTGRLQSHFVLSQGSQPCCLALQAAGAESVYETPPWSACSPDSADPAAACVVDCALPAGCWGLVLTACSSVNTPCRPAGAAIQYFSMTHLLSCFLLSECCRLCWTLASEGMPFGVVQLVTLHRGHSLLTGERVNA